MLKAAVQFLGATLAPGRLTGPIFDKELRVASRRKRNYVLRFVYLGLLTLFIALMWVNVVWRMDRGSSSYSASRMSEAGKTITVCIVWFQFVTAQCIAAVLLSNAISDEIVHQTLGVLMTTPVSAFQIVVGKLLSKMLQLVLLLAISLPLLAVVRVFGGVPWDFLLSSLAITLVAALFAGCLSLYFSIRSRRAYAVLVQTAVAGAVLYGLLPWVFVMVFLRGGGAGTAEQDMVTALLHLNPFGGMIYLTQAMMFSRARGMGGISYSWPVACAIGLGASALLLALTTATVRKVALRQATGEAGTFPTRRKSKGAVRRAAATGRTAGIRSVGDSPIVWKELRAPLFRSRTRFIVGVLAAVAVVLLTYGLCAKEGDLGDRDTHMVYGVIFVIVGTLWTAVLAATTITAEKEARTWPILLLTPLSNWQIVVGKAAGVLRRVFPAWLFLFGHVALFTVARLIHPAAFGQLLLLAGWVVLFLTGTGLYFGSRFKRTTTAVIMNLGLAVLLWIIAPFVSFMVEDSVSRHNTDFSEWLVSGNPVVQAVVILEASSGGSRAHKLLYELRYDWLNKHLGFVETTGRIILWAGGYLLVGLLFAARGRLRLRRNVF